MNIADRINQLRKQAGFSQEQLGEMLGVSRQAVSKWESSQSNPDIQFILKMCELFHVSSDYLILGKEEILGKEHSQSVSDKNKENRILIILLIFLLGCTIPFIYLHSLGLKFTEMPKLGVFFVCLLGGVITVSAYRIIILLKRNSEFS